MKNYDELTKVVIEIVQKNTKAFEGVKHSLDTLNDNNVYHLDALKMALDMNKALIEERKISMQRDSRNDKFVFIILSVFVLLIMTLIVLAGGERVFQHWQLNFFK